MPRRLGPTLRAHPVLSLAFAAAVAATLWFGVGFVRQTIYWSDPAHQAQPIEPWMTPRYIANSWLLDGRDLANALGVPPRPKERPTLSRIAEKRGVPLAQVMAEARAYIAAHAGRAGSENAPPPPPPKALPGE